MEQDWLDALQAGEIRIDTATLRAFGRFMLKELTGALVPLESGVQPALHSGAIVGMHLRSGDVETLNVSHTGCVSAAADQLAAYQQHLSVLSASAAAIAARYGTSDALARATLQAVDDQLAAALPATATGGRPVHAGGAATIVG